MTNSNNKFFFHIAKDFLTHQKSRFKENFVFDKQAFRVFFRRVYLLLAVFTSVQCTLNCVENNKKVLHFNINIVNIIILKNGLGKTYIRVRLASKKLKKTSL